MKLVSLFSGIGGIDLGLERAGMECVGQVEFDPWCTQILEKHWPDTPRWQDIHDLDPEELPAHDLIAGGFPCQPVSLAGARQAQDDPRWLWPEFFRIVRVVRPRYVLVENVPGLASAGMGDVLGDLAEIGYDCEWQSIPAAFVGAPHLRWRVFIVAYPVGDELRDKPGRRGREGGAGTSQPGNDGTSQYVADSDGGRFQGRSERHVFPTRRLESPFRHNPDGHGPRHWAVEPDVGRVADGVPRRVDRLRGLGNAVVPQVAELVGRMIMEANR